MRIEAYFQRFRDLVDACPLVQSSSITYDKRSTHEGFIRGELYFVDAREQLRFRYDNTGHRKQRNLSTYPHHKHAGNDEQVVPSLAPDLVAVLGEVETLVQLPP